MLHYICYGNYHQTSLNSDIAQLDKIVRRIKQQDEVNLGYMKWYEEQYYLKQKAIKEGHELGLRQGLEQGLEQGREEQALKDARAYIQDIRENYHGTDETILKSLVAKYGFAPETAKRLIAESGAFPV